MRNFLKSNTLLLSIALCLSAILSFWALEKDKCLEISIQEAMIGVNCKIAK